MCSGSWQVWCLSNNTISNLASNPFRIICLVSLLSNDAASLDATISLSSHAPIGYVIAVDVVLFCEMPELRVILMNILI